VKESKEAAKLLDKSTFYKGFARANLRLSQICEHNVGAMSLE
jgi:hypothetical protein